MQSQRRLRSASTRIRETKSTQVLFSFLLVQSGRINYTRRMWHPTHSMGCNLKSIDASTISSTSTVAKAEKTQTVDSCFGPNGVWYFAYGSNMNPKTLTGRRQVVPSESRPAFLRGWKLSFRMLGIPYVEPGFATIERVDRSLDSPRLGHVPYAFHPPAAPSDTGLGRWGSEVHGVLHRISVNDWIQIMTTEGVGAGSTGYRVVEVEVTHYDGHRVRALTLEAQPPSLHSPLRSISPSRRYLGLLRDGARHHGLDPDYITYLDSLSPYEGSGWNAAVGRAISVGMVVPLALPMLPPVFLLSMARNKSHEAAQSSNGQNGLSVNAVDLPSEMSSEAAAVTPKDPVDTPAAATAAGMQRMATVATTVMTLRTTREPQLQSDSGRLPDQLLRPPMLLPSVMSSYLRAVQYAAWVVHDALEATVLRSGGSDTRQR